MRTAMFLVTAIVFALTCAARSPAAGQTSDDVCVARDGVRSDHEAWTSGNWDAHEAKDSAAVVGRVNACMERWRELAVQQQAAHGACPPTGAVDMATRAAINRNGVLNDVASNYFMLGQAQERLGNATAARDAYHACSKLACARTWDPRGWFWDPSAECKTRLKTLG